MNSFVAVLAIIIAYFCGTLPIAILIAKSKGIDITTFGSGNPGASNVARALGTKYGILVFVGDALKGALPVATMISDRPVAYACAAATVLGHVFPITRKFKGGKGVATALGVLMGVSPLLGLLVALTWLGIAWFFRYSSLAALLAAILAPVYYALLADVLWWSFNGATLGLLCAMGVLLVWRHRDNVNRLIAGTESKLGAKKN